jgi:hypothetical protein
VIDYIDGVVGKRALNAAECLDALILLTIDEKKTSAECTMLSNAEDSTSMSSGLVNVGLNELLNVVSEGSCEKNRARDGIGDPEPDLEQGLTAGMEEILFNRSFYYK